MLDDTNTHPRDRLHFLHCVEQREDFGGVTDHLHAVDRLVDEIVEAFRTRYDVSVETVTTATESIAFNVPRELRDVLAPS